MLNSRQFKPFDLGDGTLEGEDLDFEQMDNRLRVGERVYPAVHHEADMDAHGYPMRTADFSDKVSYVPTESGWTAAVRRRRYKGSLEGSVSGEVHPVYAGDDGAAYSSSQPWATYAEHPERGVHAAVGDLNDAGVQKAIETIGQLPKLDSPAIGQPSIEGVRKIATRKWPWEK